MTQFYNNLSKRDKNIVDCLEIWVLHSSESKILNDRDALERTYRDNYYIKTDEIYKDYLNIKEELEKHEDYSDELLLPLMEKLLGSSFDRFKTRYRKDHPNEEWFDDIDLLLEMDLEASGGVSIDNIAFFMCKDKEFDEKVIRLSKTRFEAIGKVFKKKYAIGEARKDRKELQINKDKIFRERYDVYLFNYYTTKLTAKAIVQEVPINLFGAFLLEQKEMLQKVFSYNTPIGDERLSKRILSKMKQKSAALYRALEKEDALRLRRGQSALNIEEKTTILLSVMNKQTERYENGNDILIDIDSNFENKAICFMTLQKEHLHYHSNK